ncbi:hypothetical protein NLI96_g3438 [Meripilus lineatus]|uniref:Uncharacterized protein n=1 Tax=Meripilus lineatus TaxID=2056292 RepID=A0AAD5YL21_9APHY|nr:hypothetical protein NLI96_g3438 [Physisporinus lineatus]
MCFVRPPQSKSPSQVTPSLGPQCSFECLIAHGIPFTLKLLLSLNTILRCKNCLIFHEEFVVFGIPCAQIPSSGISSGFSTFTLRSPHPVRLISLTDPSSCQHFWVLRPSIHGLYHGEYIPFEGWDKDEYEWILTLLEADITPSSDVVNEYGLTLCSHPDNHNPIADRLPSPQIKGENSE